MLYSSERIKREEDMIAVEFAIVNLWFRIAEKLRAE